MIGIYYYYGNLLCYLYGIFINIDVNDKILCYLYGIFINIDVNDKILCYLYGIFINIVGNECFVRNGAKIAL